MSAFPNAEEDEGEGRGTSFRVGPGESGGRLDAVLAVRMPPHVSRSRVKALILDGAVTLNGEACTTPNTLCVVVGGSIAGVQSGATGRARRAAAAG